jgi:isopentenyl-diphosphate delta-isomerase type 1
VQSTDHEILDIVDERDRVIGQAQRGHIHRNKLRHRAVHVFLFNRQGQLFIQQRSSTKDSFPLCYDSSASGHLDHGEDYDACAYREVREELGLRLPAGVLTRCFYIEACADTGLEFVWVYRAQGDWQPTINRVELEDGRYLTRAEIQQIIAEHPERCARSFIRIFNEFCSRSFWPATLSCA